MIREIAPVARLRGTTGAFISPRFCKLANIAIPTSGRLGRGLGPSGVYAPIADGQVLANGR